MTRIELSRAELVAIQYAAERVPDFDCRAQLRGICKRASFAARRGEIGDESLPGVGRFGDLAALVMSTLPAPLPTRTPF